jgi:6-pyruvoyltetrahydropterin/6-carboxytetrahydropterin synthase
MAHALSQYDGKCRNIHGHSYILEVTVIGSPSTDSSSPKEGMVLDFSILKEIVNSEIIDKLDHALMLREGTEVAAGLPALSGRVVLVPYQPTCENMIADFAHKIGSHLPADVSLFSLRLHETNSSWAEWFAQDN